MHCFCLKMCASFCYGLGQATTNTTSTGSMGGLTGLQNSLPNVGAVAPNIGSNGIGNASMAGSNDALSQAYSGIQQYAGLSGLLGQGNSTFHIFQICIDWCFGVLVLLLLLLLLPLPPNVGVFGETPPNPHNLSLPTPSSTNAHRQPPATSRGIAHIT